jgi:putative FmdB family regulatory protein
MPIYVWECPSCDHTREQECRIEELERYTLRCEKCGKHMRRVISKTVFGNATEVAKKREGK